MKKQNEQEQKLTEENAELKDQLKQIHKITAPKRKILHLPKKGIQMIDGVKVVEGAPVLLMDVFE